MKLVAPYNEYLINIHSADWLHIHEFPAVSGVKVSGNMQILHW